jgi:hypothetical protein
VSDPTATLSLTADEKIVLKAWTKDLCVCTEAEMRGRWMDPAAQAAINKLDPKGFEGRLLNHNPIYFLAERVYFNNKINNPRFLYAPTHRDKLCKRLLEYALGEHDDRGFLCIMARSSFKSTFMHGVMPLWLALRAWHLEKDVLRIALIHQKEAQASANLLRLKRKTMGHPFMRANWPEACSTTEYGTKTEFTWKFVPSSGDHAESSVIACGITADLTGFHFDHIFFSDLVVKEQRKSKTLRDSTKLYYDAMTYTSEFGTGKRWHDGTPYHPNDLWSTMVKANVEGKKIYDLFILGAIEEVEQSDGSVKDELTLPIRHSWKILEDLRQEEISRTGNDDLFYLQMLCKVRSPRTLATKMEWLRTCSVKDLSPTAFGVIVVDPAWKGTKNAGEGDSASIQVWFYERRGSLVLRFLVDGRHSNEMTDAEGKSEIFRLMRKWYIGDVAPEEFGGWAFRQALSNEAITRGVSLNVIELEGVKHKIGKGQRISSFLGDVQYGRVFICEEVPMELREPFMEQYEEYAGPETLDHDDALDCAAYTSDEAITAAYVPRMNARFNAGRTSQLERRTRHCGI